VSEAAAQLQKAKTLKSTHSKNARATGELFSVKALASKYKPILKSYLR
jgi:hypothetical protein